jgi:3-phenylpropionate/cinnamic acid dioxygenase small subunit
MSYPTAVTDATDLYGSIQSFYAEQMHLLDAGATTEWAATFTEDGVFAADGHPHPAVGRSDIAAAAQSTVDKLAAAGRRHRHWLGMLTVRPNGDDSVRATCYALVIDVPRGGDPTIHRSTVCHDRLVPAGGTWLVADRKVTRDDLS